MIILFLNIPPAEFQLPNFPAKLAAFSESSSSLDGNELISEMNLTSEEISLPLRRVELPCTRLQSGLEESGGSSGGSFLSLDLSSSLLEI